MATKKTMNIHSKSFSFSKLYHEKIILKNEYHVDFVGNIQLYEFEREAANAACLQGLVRLRQLP